MKTSKLMGCLVLLGALIVPAFSSFAQQVSVPLGQSMLSRENIKINVSTAAPFSIGRESIVMVNNSITVTLRSYDAQSLPGPVPPSYYVPATNADVDLGRLPQGTYSVQVNFLSQITSATQLVGTTQFTVTEDITSRLEAFPAYNFTDIWWNPAESGWGLTIFVKRATLFAAWFAYDAAGQPTWYTLQQGIWLTANTFRGQIYATTSNPNAGIGPLSSLTVAPVGTATLAFTGMNQAVFTYDINGVFGTKNIVRQVF